MYAEGLRRNIVAAAVKADALSHAGRSVAAVDAIVSDDDAGTSVILANRHPTATARCLVKLDGAPLTGTFAARSLEGSSPDSYNSVEHPDAVVPRDATVASSDGYFDVPPHALLVLEK